MSLVVVCAALLLVSLTAYSFVSRTGRPPLPPGPKGSLLSGNAQQLPRAEPWKAFAVWSDRFGSPIVTYRIFSRRTIILNTWRAASDLLESRSKLYSDRPMSWMYHELVGRKLAVFNISSQHPRFPIYRRMLNSSLNPRVVEEYDDLLVDESHTLLNGLKSSPESFASHFRRNAGAIILRVAYGWTVTKDDDYLVGLMEHVFELGVEATRPGRWLVDVFPFLRYVPSWFPGATFKRSAAYYRTEFAKSESIPHAWAKDQIRSSDYYESFTSRHLKPDDGRVVTAEEEDIVKWCAAALYAGGADTTVAALLSFVLLMTLHPEAQARAQSEIDEVIGEDILPTFTDELRLPFVSALVKEVLRFAPVAPLGLPHRVLREDHYEGLRIPKLSTVMANIWAISRDPELYTKPGTFNPDRFMGSNAEQDPRKHVFGFGRRICPGLHFAERSLFLNISRILASFKILPPVDEAGEVIACEPIWSTGITSHPLAFKCRFVPRRASES